MAKAFWVVVLLYSALSFSMRPHLVLGEQILKKEGGEYLGWKTGADEFKTCKSTPIKIGNGVVVDTTERCSPTPPPPLAKGLTYPTRPVRLIVGFPPGGAVDLLARITAPKLSERWGQQVVVDNRPGAGSRIAAEITAKAAADGYTLLMITSSHAVGAGLYGKLAYHPVDSFSAVTLVGSTPLVLLTHPSVPVKSVKELIALAKARPGQLNFGSSGTGGITHLAGELFKGMAGINIVHVPYKGTGPAFTDFIAGQVNLMFPALPGALPHVKAGRVKAIALSSAKRSPALPEVPTIAEAGVAGYEVTNWYGLLAPAGTDRKIVERLHDEFAAVLRMPDVAEAFARAGAEPVSSTPREFEAYIKSEIAKWGRVIRTVGIKAE